jgi:hypothetical protein
MALDGSRSEYYRSRARIARAMAEKCAMPDIKRDYERVAEQYEQLAFQVEKRQIPD